MTAPVTLVPQPKGPYATTRRVGDVLYLSGRGRSTPRPGNLCWTTSARRRAAPWRTSRRCCSRGIRPRRPGSGHVLSDRYGRMVGDERGVCGLPRWSSSAGAHRRPGVQAPVRDQSGAGMRRSPRQLRGMRAAKFDLELTPRQRDGAWVGFDVRYIADAPEVAAGQAVLSVPQTVVSIPGTPYRTEDLTVSDAEGPLTLSESAATADSSGEYRHWTADRATRGALTVVFHAPVRPHDEHTPVGPLFDLRAEDPRTLRCRHYLSPPPGRRHARRRAELRDLPHLAPRRGC